ncbi:polyphosphate kinase 1 [soil metagenome]
MKPADRFLNRELSWLRFNERVLEEAGSKANPLLERLKFLAIFETNLDEFYMVRVSGLIEQFESGTLETSPDGMTPTDQLRNISQTAGPLRQRAAKMLHETVLPALEKHGLVVRSYGDLSDRQKRELDRYFLSDVFPVLTPLVLYPAPTVPFISNRSLNLAIEIRDDHGDLRLGRVKIPSVVPRFVRIGKRKLDVVPLEELIAANIHHMFPGVEISGSYLFRVLRDADVEIQDRTHIDLRATIEETLRLRRFGDPVLLQFQANTPPHIVEPLKEMLDLDEEDLFPIDGMLAMEGLFELARIDRPALRFAPHRPFVPEPLSKSRDLFEAIRAQDILVHHPYDGFRVVEEMVASAAIDPDTVGIKQTLYRVGKESPIVESLLAAAEEDKQVAAMVELKARFDESNNLVWARALEQAGVHVSYGFTELKTHCKLCLVVRREGGRTRQYVHIGTGNYNPVTARLYTDLGLFTCDEAICQDVSELFNYLTGFSKPTKYRKILVAPVNLREGLLSRIRREARLARQQGTGRILFKLNALVDPEIIDALYDADAAGVKIDLIVRGMCCLRPGVPKLSERTRVVSVVGRFLEHSRVYWFGHNDRPEVYIGSADAMRRNLDRRIEVLAPVENPNLQTLIMKRVLEPCLKDNQGAWILQSDGEYKRRQPGEEKPFDSQSWFAAHPLTKDQFPAER